MIRNQMEHPEMLNDVTSIRGLIRHKIRVKGRGGRNRVRVTARRRQVRELMRLLMEAGQVAAL